jgi:hypothetical protein
MATRPLSSDEHYRRAESILTGVENGEYTNHTHMLRLAQIHATLSLRSNPLRPNPLITSTGEDWEQKDWEKRQKAHPPTG